MKCEVFKSTSDDWYPSYFTAYGERLVRVAFTQTGPNPPTVGDWRVCVWGADDCGMERDFTVYEDAWDCFLNVILLEDVTMNELSSRGFISA